MGVPHHTLSSQLFDYLARKLKNSRYLRKIANPKLEKYRVRKGSMWYAQTTGV